MSDAPSQTRLRYSPLYPWVIVGLLWFCGFFNYADRQALTSVLPPLQKEFTLTNLQLGLLGSAFMVVYALAAPFSGFVVDTASRRVLVIAGLAFWSVICAMTGMARSFGQLLFCRAVEGLGESFYFPASMSLLADYHGPRTRSRAMSVHQTSVYVGSAGGGLLAGWLGDHWGWRAPFWILGVIGVAYAAILWTGIIEPVRGKGEGAMPPIEADFVRQRQGLLANLAEIVQAPVAVLLLAVFAGANFVAAVFLTWLTMFIYQKFRLGLTMSSVTSTWFPLANLVGALAGGVLADIAARRAGGRIRVQAFGLIVGAPFVFAVGRAETVPSLILALVGVGLCKGVYDANIFASLYDVVRPEIRGTAAGLMNTVGWSGACFAPTAIGWMSDRYGLDRSIASTAVIYAVVGVIALAAAQLATHKGRPGVTEL